MNAQSILLLLTVLLVVVAGGIYLDSLRAGGDEAVASAASEADVSFDIAEWIPFLPSRQPSGQQLELLGTRNLLLALMAASAWALTWRRVRRRAR